MGLIISGFLKSKQSKMLSLQIDALFAGFFMFNYVIFA